MSFKTPRHTFSPLRRTWFSDGALRCPLLSFGFRTRSRFPRQGKNELIHSLACAIASILIVEHVLRVQQVHERVVDVEVSSLHVESANPLKVEAAVIRITHGEDALG